MYLGDDVWFVSNTIIGVLFINNRLIVVYYLGYDVRFVESGDVVLLLDGPGLDPDVRDNHRTRTEGAAVEQA